MPSAKELREKTDQELQDQLALEKKRMFDAMVRGASGEAIKPHEKRYGKRLIARIETILNERKLRKRLNELVAKREGESQGAHGEFARLAKAEPRPSLGRVKIRHKYLSAADRAAVRLAESKRLRVCLVRDDPGEEK